MTCCRAVRPVSKNERKNLVPSLILPAANSSDLAIAVPTAERILREGGLVVIPTDTVYGVAAMADHGDAVGRVFDAKGRPSRRSLPILVDSAERAWEITRDASPEARRLGRQYWPGGLTLVLASDHRFAPQVAAADGSIGVRVPAHPTALAILQACGGCLAVTSANRSGEPSARTAEEAAAALGGWVGAVLDGGPSALGRDSTIVDARGANPVLLRQGAIPWDDILTAWSGR